VLELSVPQADALRAAMAGDRDSVAVFGQQASSHPIRLSAEVVAVKTVESDAGVSYGHTYRTSSATTLALVAIGYGHGVPRKAGNRADVTWRGTDGSAQRFPIVGRVAMDVLVVDAGDAPVALGDKVVLFGDPALGEIPLATWAASIDEHPLAVVAGLDDRIEREVRA